ncbi:MAG: N-acetylglucosamine kinase [Alphaproteobacteria bacterium]|nr:N-acetylglucosamine kinase [Alphaproteobacteria bacterium]
MADKYYLGIDGGGTNCRMRLVDTDLQTLGDAAIDSPSNLQLRDGDAAFEAVSALIPRVYANAGLPVSAAARTFACAGMAGGRLESARREFSARKFPFAGLSVFDDIDIARAGAHAGEDGAVLIVGTGSAGMAMIEGIRFQIGGWGFHLGDDMAGALLGRELLRRTLLANDEMIAATPLSDAVLARFGNDPGALMAFSFDFDGSGRPARPVDYGQFVPLFFEYFEKNDPLAVDLMQFQLAAMDKYVDWFTQRGAKTIAVVGGFGTRLYPQLEKRYGSAIVRPKARPLHGAVILARQLYPGP